jgi:hypothetical protein
MNILTRNYRDTVKTIKEESIRDLIKMENAYALLIQETKLSEEEATSIGKKLWKWKSLHTYHSRDEAK